MPARCVLTKRKLFAFATILEMVISIHKLQFSGIRGCLDPSQAQIVRSSPPYLSPTLSNTIIYIFPTGFRQCNTNSLFAKLALYERHIYALFCHFLFLSKFMALMKAHNIVHTYVSNNNMYIVHLGLL